MNITRLLAFFTSFFLLCPIYASVDSYFSHIKKDSSALYAFFKTMPKGGELHYHLAGGAYPETMLALAANGNYCLDKHSFAVSKDSSHCEGVNVKEVFNNPELYSNIIKDWSMKDFIPGKESGHDHFFNGFVKYMPIVFDYRPQLLADIVQRAAQQKEQYMEIMIIPDNAHSLTYGDLIKDIPSYDQKRRLLLANKDFQSNIKNTVLESDRILTKASQELGCKDNPSSDSCLVKIKFIYYVLREQPVDNVFAQALNAFEAVSKSKGNLIGVNLVQPEDGIISLRDYHKHMSIFEYLHRIYPNVPITLHAGELSPQAVTPENLSNHIRDALLIGHAQRIGHGVDIGYENNAEDTLKYMANHHIPVEINLISNLKILDISGRNHPLNYYLAHNVPVVLSTDDEGVLRTDLTQQYVEAAKEHGLNYQQLKQINRNTLTYSFLPGKSIWANADKAELIPDCHDLESKSCQKFIEHNEKAKLQWSLEQQLIAFEKNY
ncbi:TPA: adenosine deaminase [Legionella pneumophila]|uniref:adenosine deaminase family protein n=1 Tax=Legionella pneumophila TaxID=446 RepID=UPI000487876B|nr:adenosine deaminase [Legionella pneumophila]MCK1847823.1 adenosine deaminase [Legionella pneumophila]MCZ4804760.1 adenosine deaminase [Legionella pneumophila]MDI9850650.1 adenosine deaminase [Legionella pneumophila]MDO5159625.1 adenosine deaminase [Legionella pneumophila]MDO5161891.1 adenosine deaminase [Legionella pneumophila]